MHFIILLMSKFFDAFKGVFWYLFGGGGGGGGELC